MPPTPFDPPRPDAQEGPEPAPLVRGDRIGRFLVQDLHGQGGMGAVYEAWDPVLERKVALKAIRLVEDGKAEALARFRREAMALAQLNHPNVCQVHDWVEVGGEAYIAMEFIEGSTLAEAARGMDIRRRLQALRSIARALEAAHAKGIVHRDLKPGNVMVDAQGRVKVLDFGLARLADATPEEELRSTGGAPNLERLLEESGEEPTRAAPLDIRGGSSDLREGSSGSSWHDMTVAGLFVGTPSHASPEQISGRRVGAPSDVFSLGLVAWELLLDGPAFPGEGRVRMDAVLRGTPNPMRKRLPRRISALLRAMLQRNPDRRPTAGQVADTLSRQLSGVPARVWIGGGAAVLVAALAFAYLLFGRSVVADLVRERPPRLVVLPLRNETGEASLEALVGVGMTDLLATSLRGAPSLTVVEPESVARAMAGLHMPASDLPQPASQLRIAKALGAPLLLRGAVRQASGGSGLAFTYELVDASGRRRLAGDIHVPRLASFEPYALVEPAARDLLRKVDPLHAVDTRSAPVPPAVFAAYATGRALFLKGDFKASEAPLREAAFKAPAFSSAVSTYAACLRRLGEPAAADAANWALMSARATGDRWSEVRALGLSAYLARDRGDLDESTRLREASLDLAQAIGDVDGQIVATNHLGLLAAERGRNAEAKALYGRSLELSRNLGDQIYQALTEINLANLALEQGDFVAAGDLYGANLRIQQELGNRWGEALALNNLGIVSLMTRDLPRAEEELGRALALREAAGDKAGQATCLRNLGILALMKGQPGVSAGFHARALVLAQQSGLHAVEAECRFYAADLDRLDRHFDQAREGYRKVLDLLPEGVTPGVRDNARAGLAECLARQPRPDLQKAGQLLAAVGSEDADSPFVLRARAWLDHASGRSVAAVTDLAKALADPHRGAPELQAELESTRARFLAER